MAWLRPHRQSHHPTNFNLIIYYKRPFKPSVPTHLSRFAISALDGSCVTALSVYDVRQPLLSRYLPATHVPSVP
jgi:hypothetical protein